MTLDKPTPTEQEQAWINAWRVAGPELERIREEELRNLTDEEGARIATLLGIPPELIRPRESNINQLAALLAKQTH